MIAICGPGREVRTALLLALRGETASHIYPTRYLPDPDSVYLISDDANPFFRPLDFEPYDPPGPLPPMPFTDHGPPVTPTIP